jgi:iron complex outermembrane recepter protein
MKSTFNTVLRGASVIAVLQAGAAFAQTASNEEPARKAGEKPEEVIVTGTFIRGIAPESSQTISVDAVAIQATGVTSTVDLMQTVPQLADFQNLSTITSTNQVQVNSNSVNLRQLPGGGSTLLLMDGRRVAGAGIKSTDPDPDFLPPSVIERVEVVLDGGSAIYGADAVGGVVNFITRRRFDGVLLDGRYGVGDKYEQYDANAMVGTDWKSGSAYIAYNYAYHDSIYGRDRDFVQRRNWATGQQLDLQCVPGNVTIGGTAVYGLPGLAPNAPNRCDLSDARTYYTDDTRHSFFGSLTQDIGDRVVVDLTGFYTQRDRAEDLGTRTSTASISPTIPGTAIPNSAYRSTGDANAGRPQSVSINFAPVFGYSTPSTYALDVWGITPTLTWDIGNDWQLKALVDYGKGEAETDESAINPVALGTGVAIGTVNPYDLTRSSPTALAAVGNWHIFGQSENELANARAVVDGPLFAMPGGDLRAAIGLEYIHEDYRARAGSTVPGTEDATLPWGGGDREVYAAFVEVNVPIVGEKNSMTGIHSLTASLSGRYDDYSDFGDTFNPKIGLNYKPVDWLNLRANWGKAFTAPTLATSAAVDTMILLLPSAILVNPFVPPPPGVQVQEVTAQGGVSDLLPQEATTWSVGADIEFPFAPGLSLSVSYYKVEIEQLIGLTPVFAAEFYANYPELYTMFPTQAQVEAFAATIPGGPAAVANVFGPGRPLVYALIDGRRRNLGATKVDGVDLSGHYVHQTGFGTIFTNLDSSYRLSRENAPRTGAPYGDDVSDDSPKLRVSATLGTTVGDLTAQATYRFLDGFDIAPTVGNNFQSSVDSFETVDLFFKYDIDGAGLLDRASISANINNVFDEEPSTYQGIFSVVSDGYANGGTVGRLYQVGFRVEF